MKNLFFAFSLVILIAGCHTGQVPTAYNPDRSIYIPHADDLVRTIRVGAVTDGEQLQIRYVFATENPSWYHQYWVYEDGRWNLYGSTPVGPHADGLYEDRISIAIDNGGIEGYETFGGFVVSHPGTRSRTDAVDAQAVEDHPYLGEHLGVSDVRKYIPQSRQDPLGDNTWSQTRTPEQIQQLQEQGVFLDTWQWRAHRSNPMGYADNGYVLDYRHSADGRGMYTTNWNRDTSQPQWMFDLDKTGKYAMQRDRLLTGGYGQDDLYYLAEDFAVPFDPDHAWQDGDTLPQRLLREPSGSRGSIQAQGRYQDGAWRVQVTRQLEPVSRLDSHVIEPGHIYNAQVAVHADASTGRWHYVTMPFTLSLDQDTELRVAQAPPGMELNQAEANWIELPIFYPGQITWQQILEDPVAIDLFQQAREDPTDLQAVRRLASFLVAQEQRTSGAHREKRDQSTIATHLHKPARCRMRCTHAPQGVAR